MQSKQRLAAAFVLILLLTTSLLSACAPLAATNGETFPLKEKVKIRFAALPIIDALPLYAAQKEGFFEQNNVEVEFIPVGSAAERDQLVAAKQADAMINDLVSVALYNKESPQVVTVRYARMADPQNAMYRLLAAKDSGIKTAQDLAGVPVGMSQGTIIDYVTSRMLESKGLTPDQIESVAVPKMDQRLALLQSGELRAATLPEPFATIAMQQGAVLIVDDTQDPTYGSFSNSVISFRKEFIDQHPGAVKAFLKAVSAGVAAVTKDAEKYRPLLGEYKLVPPAVQASYPIPAFIADSYPPKNTFDEAVAWAKARGLVKNDIRYEDSVTGEYLNFE